MVVAPRDRHPEAPPPPRSPWSRRRPRENGGQSGHFASGTPDGGEGNPEGPPGNTLATILRPQAPRGATAPALYWAFYCAIGHPGPKSRLPPLKRKPQVWGFGDGLWARPRPGGSGEALGQGAPGFCRLENEDGHFPLTRNLGAARPPAPRQGPCGGLATHVGFGRFGGVGSDSGKGCR
jgi:hypothetical protein